MRRVRYSVASSLDGFIAGPNGEYDWIPMDPDIDFAAMFSNFDTMLMGRKTYEVAKTAGPEQTGMWKGMRVIVCSNSLNPDTHSDVEIVGKDLPGFIQKLKSEPGKDIWLFGGGDLFRSLLEEGLVDQVEVGLVPVLLGHGIPMLPKMNKKVRLELASQKVYPKTGTLMLNYNVLSD